MTLHQLIAIMHAPQLRCATFYPFLVEGMSEYDILSPQRQACFLATIAHESGSLQYTSEIWGPTDAQKRYEGRQDLGNIFTGDGSRFRGRGLIQITGRTNYAMAAHDLGVAYIDSPERLAQPRDAAISACWWWAKHGCNELADVQGFEAVTRRVNGGMNGWSSRKSFYDVARSVLSVPDFTCVDAGVGSTAPKVD